MTCEVETRGGRRTMELRRRGSTWELSLDGRILNVDVTASAGRLSLLIGPPSPAASAGQVPPSPAASAARARRSYEVAVERRSNGDRIVYVNGLAVPVSLVDPRERLVRRRGSASAETGPRSIVSPMPGRIVKVLVREGDVVAAHQGLVVVEAMKMENELRAPRAGTVSAVKVVEGMSVETRAVLVTLA
jgi:biotin carboxyl carrier protein